MKKNILLTILFAISATQTMLPAEQEQSPKGWKKLCKTYATSLISGGLIGSVTGVLSIQAIARSMDIAQQFAIKPASVTGAGVFGIIVPTIILVAENRLRNTLTDDNAINHNKNLLRDTAWISSWIAFLYFIKFDA